MNEARAAYEVTKERSSWEVIIGKSDDADDTLVNDDFLQEETLQPSPRLASSRLFARWNLGSDLKDPASSFYICFCIFNFFPFLDIFYNLCNI